MLKHFINQLRVRDVPNANRADVDLSDVDEAFVREGEACLKKIETLRLEKLEIFKFRRRIGIPVAFIITPFLGFADYWLLFFQRGSDDSAAGLTFLFLGGLYWWVTQPRRQYVKRYKEIAMPLIATLLGNFTYRVDGKIPSSILTESKVAPHYDRYKGEDYFEGEYKGVDVLLSEIKLERRHRDSKGRTRYRTVFKGLAIVISLKNKRFYGHTIVDKNKGRIGEFFKEKSSSMRRADLVDPEFEKTFDVYTTDQVEARYLLDPAMIERFKTLQLYYNGDDIRAAFFDDALLMLIRSDYNYFEPEGVDVPATDLRSLILMKQEVEEVLSLVDCLRLYDPAKVHRESETTRSLSNESA